MPVVGHWASGQIVTATKLNSSLLQTGTAGAATDVGAAGVTGRWYVNTTAATVRMERDNGTSWVTLIDTDDAAGTGSLRTLGTGDFQGAVGSHTHTDVKEFSANGTWTKPASATRVLVQVGGAGGGGQVGQSTGAGGGNGGEGGYGGDYVCFMVDATLLGAIETVTIGAGGASGSRGSTTSVSNVVSVLGGMSGGTPQISPPWMEYGSRGGAGGVQLPGSNGTSNTPGGGGGGGGGGRAAGVGQAGGAGGAVAFGGQAGGGGGAGANTGSNGTVGSNGTNGSISRPAGGGGGGGGCGNTGGNGGVGGTGYVRIVTYLNMNIPTVP